MLLARDTVEVEQHRGFDRRHRGDRAIAARGEIGQRGVGFERVDLEILRARRACGAHGDRPAPHPAALVHEIVGDRGEHVVEVGEQVAPAIAVAVDRVLAVARWHELAPAHRAGVAAGQGADVEAGFLFQREQLRQLAAEERLAAVLAVGLGRLAGARVGERERIQRIDHRVLAGVGAEAGFDADDGHDDFSRYACLRLDPGKLVAMSGEERLAAIDAHLGDEDRPIVAPRLGFGRSRHGRDNTVADLRARQHGFDMGGVDAVAGGGVAHEQRACLRQRHRHHRIGQRMGARRDRFRRGGCWHRSGRNRRRRLRSAGGHREREHANESAMGEVVSAHRGEGSTRSRGSKPRGWVFMNVESG